MHLLNVILDVLWLLLKVMMHEYINVYLNKILNVLEHVLIHLNFDKYELMNFVQMLITIIYEYLDVLIIINFYIHVNVHEYFLHELWIVQ
jgi:hypothetical protein